MRIGIDATGVYGQMFGIHLYAEQLLRRLLTLPSDHAFVLFCRKAAPQSLRAIADERVSFVVGGFNNRKLTEQLWLPRMIGPAKLDLFHATYGRPFYCPVPTVLTLHDLFMVRFPERYSRSWKAYHRLGIERGARKAEHLVCVSEATARDAHELLGIDRERTTVVPLGVDHDRFNPVERSDVAAMRERHKLPERYLLHVGGFSPIKNTQRVVEAFAGAVGQGLADDVQLVYAGKKGGQYEATLAAAERLGVADRVVFTDYFPAEDLAALYTGALALVYPSLIEGFGLPILEAFACGTRVITSDRFSMPEVAGDAGTLVDPEDTGQLAHAIQQAVERVKEPVEPDTRCIERAGQFGWERTAQQTLAVYDRVLEQMTTGTATSRGQLGDG